MLLKSGIESQKIAKYALSSYCICFSLSIALGQIFLAIFFLAMLFSFLGKDKPLLSNILNSIRIFISENKKILIIFYFPALIWLSVLGLSSMAGLRPVYSFFSLLKYLPYFSIPLFVMAFLKMETNFKTESVWNVIRYYAVLLFIGQSIAAAHTILSSYFGYEFKPRTPGPLTESGQIALLFPMYLAIVFILIDSLEVKRVSYYFIIGFLTLGLSLVSWSNFLPISEFYRICIVICVMISFLILIKYNTQVKKETLYFAIFGALMLVALLVNLKRGPWLSVIVSTFAFSYLFSYRKVFAVFVLVVSICFLPPVWDRIADFSEHFFIGGGRFDMWKLGFQLIERYPIGIGYANSALIREFDPTLPLLHRHMHNNILNVTLENGILGGIIYVWWFAYYLIESIKIIFKKRLSLIKDKRRLELVSYSLVLAIFGFQVAGLVEYNFGDGEIRLLFFVLTGFLLTLLTTISKYNDSV